ncbi:hypothetical protein MKX01_002335 [Papaver californicum]|nr:hypothetical protein MKX01_002335 [Papaver californicum]
MGEWKGLDLRAASPDEFAESKWPPCKVTNDSLNLDAFREFGITNYHLIILYTGQIGFVSELFWC